MILEIVTYEVHVLFVIPTVDQPFWEIIILIDKRLRKKFNFISSASLACVPDHVAWVHDAPGASIGVTCVCL